MDDVASAWVAGSECCALALHVCVCVVLSAVWPGLHCLLCWVCSATPLNVQGLDLSLNIVKSVASLNGEQLIACDWNYESSTHMHLRMVDIMLIN